MLLRFLFFYKKTNLGLTWWNGFISICWEELSGRLYSLLGKGKSVAFLHVLHIAGQAKQVGACMFILKAQYFALYTLLEHLIAWVGNRVGTGLRWTCKLFLRPYFPFTISFLKLQRNCLEDLLDKHMGNHGIVLQVIPYFDISDFVFSIILHSSIVLPLPACNLFSSRMNVLRC